MTKNFFSIGLKQIAKKISIHQRMPEFVSFILRQKTLFLILLLNRTDEKERGTIKLVKRSLKDNAYPSIFNNLPAYYTYKSIPTCSGVALCSARHENATARLEEQCDTFLNAHKLEILMIFFKKYLKKFTIKNICCIKLMRELICSTYHHNNLFPFKL